MTAVQGLTKRRLASPLGLFVLLAMLALVALPAYAIIVALALILPPLLVIFSFQDAYERKELADIRKIGVRLFMALIVLPVALLAFAAPLRALLVAAFSFHPPALHRFYEAHELLHGRFGPFPGALGPYWLDLSWGLLGTLAIFTFAALDSLRRGMLAAQVRNLSTSRVRSAAVGLVELAGKAVALEGAPGAAPIIRSWFKRTDKGYSVQTEIKPFYLDDGTGRILVDATGAQVDSDADAFTMGLHQVKLKHHVGEDGLPEGRLMPGDPVFVVGNVQINDDPVHKAANPVVIKPRRSSLLRLHYYDLFFVASGGEREQLEAFTRSISRGWPVVTMLMAVTFWLAVNAWTNIRQVEDLDLDAAPAFFRMVSAPTLMERKIAVSGMGTAPALHWIAQLRQPAGDKQAIMEELHRQHLARFAIPVLLQPAADIDHRDFRVSNHWLMTFKALPAGEWGYEYVSKPREARDTQILRVKIKRAGARLFASCDAYFSEFVSTTRSVAARKLVFAFRNAATGAVLSAEIPATPGWNKVRDVPLFERFSPAEYHVRITAKREYAGNAYEEDVWMAPEITMELR